MFTLTLDSIMEKLHIAEDTDCNGNGFNRTRNIFDELVAKVEKGFGEVEYTPFLLYQLS